MTKVYLNVYDLNIQMNKVTYNLGFGMFHSGLQINGTEYSFGGHDQDSTGVYQASPKVNHPNFRESILLGQTKLSNRQITKVIDTLRDQFIGNRYDVVKKNCNVFTDTLCRELLGFGIPGFVNRLANIGSGIYSCIDFIRLRKVQSNDYYRNLSDQESKQFVQFKGEGCKLGQ